MKNTRQKDISRFYQDAFSEMYVVNTLINVARSNCLEKEFKAEYYGIPLEFTGYISDERNDYINILSVVADRISNLIELYLLHENEFGYNSTPTIAADK